MEADNFDTFSADIDLIDTSSSRIPRCLRRLSLPFIRYRKLAKQQRCPLSFDNPNYVEAVEGKPFQSCQTSGSYCAFCDGLLLTTRGPKSSLKTLCRNLKRRLRVAKSNGGLHFNSFEDSIVALSLAYEDSSENPLAPPYIGTCYYAMFPINPENDHHHNAYGSCSGDDSPADVAVSLRRLIEDCDRSEAELELELEGESEGCTSEDAEETSFLPTVAPFRGLEEEEVEESWLKLVWDQQEPSCFYVVLDFSASRLSRAEAKKLLTLNKADFHQVMRYVVSELKQHHDQCKTN